MRSRLFLLLSLSLATSLSIYSARTWASAPDAPGLYSPRLTTDSDIVRLLIWAHNYIPSLFTQAAVYNLDLLKIVGDQNILIQKLSQDPEYQKLLRARGPLLNVEIKPEAKLSASNQGTGKVTEVDGLKENLRAALDSLVASGKPLGEELKQQVSEGQNNLGHRSSDKLLVGLAQFLPEQQRKAIFKNISFEQKTEILRAALPESLPLAEKNREKFLEINGFSTIPTREEALNALQNLQKKERLLSQLSVLEGLYRKMSAEATGLSLEDFKSKILSLTESDFTEVSKSLAPRGKALIKEFSTFGEPVKGGFGESIHLLEIPPWLSIFRGCAGVDCSTQRVFATVDDPNERVFLILDAEKKIKGYVEGTLIDSAEGPGFYLNSISGVRISAKDTELVINAMDQIKEKLDANRIYFPVEKKMTDLNNYTPIRETFRQYTKGLEPVSISFPSKEVRKQIEAYDVENNKSSYDRMEKNSEAVPFQREKISPPRFQMKVAHWQMPEVEKQSLNPIQVIELALDLNYSPNVQEEGLRAGETKRVLRAGGISEVLLDPLIHTLANEQKLPVESFKQKAQEQAKVLGLDAKFFENKEYLLYPGRLFSSNAWEKENQAATVHALVEALKINVESPQALRLIKSHASELSTDPVFVKGIKSLLKGGIGSDQTRYFFENIMNRLPHLDPGYASLLAEYAIDDFNPTREGARWSLRRMRPLQPEFFEVLNELTQRKDLEVSKRAESLLTEFSKPSDRARPLDPPIQIRAAEEKDIDAVLGLEKESFESDLAYTRGQLQKYIHSKNGLFLVATEGDKVIGHLISEFHEVEKAGEISTLAVTSEARGQRLGKKLVVEGILKLHQMGAKRVDLHVESSNTHAIQVYESLGFARKSKIPGHYGKDRTALLMRLDVTTGNCFKLEYENLLTKLKEATAPL